MRGDLILRVIIAFLIPFLLLFGFFSIVDYNIFGIYSFALAFLYFLLVYVLLFLRHKYLNSTNLALFGFLGTMIISIFSILLIFILLILLNVNIPILYDYIRF